MNEYLIVNICNNTNVIDNDIIKANSKKEAYDYFYNNLADEDWIILNIINLTE